MGGCQAAMAAGWPALCQVTRFAWQAQGIAERVTGAAGAISAAGPLSLALLLLLGVVGLVVAWQVLMVLCRALYTVYPYAIALGLALLLFSH